MHWRWCSDKCGHGFDFSKKAIYRYQFFAKMYANLILPRVTQGSAESKILVVGSIIPQSIVILGLPRSGKSTLLATIWRDNEFTKSYDKIMFFTSAKMDQFYKQFQAKNVTMLDEYDPALVEAIIKEQAARSEANKKMQNILFVLDDIYSAKYDSQLLKLFMMGRHAGCSVIISTQTPTLVNKQYRGIANHIFITARMGGSDLQYVKDNILDAYVPAFIEGRAARSHYIDEFFYDLVGPDKRDPHLFWYIDNDRGFTLEDTVFPYVAKLTDETSSESSSATSSKTPSLLERWGFL